MLHPNITKEEVLALLGMPDEQKETKYSSVWRYGILQVSFGKLKIGMTKADVRELLGPPEAWGGTSRKYREPCIWKYGTLQLTFLTKKYRTPYPGPVLIRVTDTNIEDSEVN